MRRRRFLKTKMQPADLVALVSLGDTLKVDQDFTADKDALINEVGVYNGTEGAGICAGRNREFKPGGGHDRLHARRERVQRPEYRPRAVCAAGGCAVAGKDQSRRSRCSISPAAFRATALRTRRRCVRPSTRRCAPTCPSTAWTRAACRRLARWAMHRRGAMRGSGGFNGAALDQQHERELRHPGSDGDALERYRRQGVLRLQRFCAGVCAGAEGYFGLLRHRLSLDESGARRQVSQADGEGEEPGREAGIPAGLLCAGGLQALRQGGSRAGA